MSKAMSWQSVLFCAQTRVLLNKLGSCYQKIGFGTKFFEKITKTEVLHQK